MRLIDLGATFLKRLPNGNSQTGVSLSEADGIMFQCPKCAEGKERGEEDGRRFVRGAHHIICWFRGKVPDDLSPKPGRWTPQGTGLDDLSPKPGDPPMAVSVLLTSGCGWHGHVRNGDAS